MVLQSLISPACKSRIINEIRKLSSKGCSKPAGFVNKKSVAAAAAKSSTEDDFLSVLEKFVHT